MSYGGSGLAQTLMDIHVEEMLHEAATRRLMQQARKERSGRLSRPTRRLVAHLVKLPMLLVTHRLGDTMPQAAACEGPKRFSVSDPPPPIAACRC